MIATSAGSPVTAAREEIYWASNGNGRPTLLAA